MPRNTPEQAAARRDEIARAAWRCFSRNGFHATSMDDVIAEAGLSAGAVYRYFPGKAALISTAVENAFTLARGVFEDLLAQDPPPPPEVAIGRAAGRVAELSAQQGFDLSRLAGTAWGEALRDAQLAELARAVYGRFRQHFGLLARRWQEAGHVSPDADPDEVAAAALALLPGFMVQRVLLGDLEPAAYARGVAALLGR